MRVRRALMWLFLRPAIRGGKRGRRMSSQQGGAGLVAARLQQDGNGEQMGLIQSLRMERLRVARSTQSRAQRDNQSQTQAEGRGTAGDTTKLLELIGRGTFDKAATQLASLGVLSASDPAVVAQLRQKHPQLGYRVGRGTGTSMPPLGEYDMPAAYGEDQPDFMRVDHVQLAEDCRALKREKAVAPNAGRNGHYQLFGSAFPTGSREERALKDLAFFGECYLNALLPPWYYRLSAAARLVALLKSECAAGETPQVRPVAVGGIERTSSPGPFWAQRFAEAPPKSRRLLPLSAPSWGRAPPLAATGASWADFASVEGTQHTAGLPARAGTVLHVV
jgi:hypothetical protein